MTTSIKTWQIVDGKLTPIDTTLADQGRTEHYDLESWIAADPSILAPDIVIIGRQVSTRSGPLDLLAIDGSGNLVVIELKRGGLPREVLAQAMDYASDVSGWSIDKIGEVCAKHTGRDLEDVLSEVFPNVDVAGLNVNEAQRIILVGFSIESQLERMISWLSSSYGVGVNAVLLQYSKTANGDELLTKTAIISEELEQERVKKRKFKIPMSDEPGTYDEDELRRLLSEYLARGDRTIRLIRDALLPILLETERVGRADLVKEFFDRGASESLSSAGFSFVHISRQVGMAKNDFLRQVIGYGYPNYPWEKDGYHIRSGYKDLVRSVLEALAAGEARTGRAE